MSVCCTTCFRSSSKLSPVASLVFWISFGFPSLYVMLLKMSEHFFMSLTFPKFDARTLLGGACINLCDSPIWISSIKRPQWRILLWAQPCTCGSRFLEGEHALVAEIFSLCFEVINTNIIVHCTILSSDWSPLGEILSLPLQTKRRLHFVKDRSTNLEPTKKRTKYSADQCMDTSVSGEHGRLLFGALVCTSGIGLLTWYWFLGRVPF